MKRLARSITTEVLRSYFRDPSGTFWQFHERVDSVEMTKKVVWDYIKGRFRR